MTPIGAILFFVGRLVFQLPRSAFAQIDVITLAQINGLREDVAVREGVEKPHFDNITRTRNTVICWDGDVADMLPTVRAKQTDGYTTLSVHLRHQRTERSDEFVLQLIAT